MKVSTPLIEIESTKCGHGVKILIEEKGYAPQKLFLTISDLRLLNSLINDYIEGYDDLDAHFKSRKIEEGE